MSGITGVKFKFSVSQIMIKFWDPSIRPKINYTVLDLIPFSTRFLSKITPNGYVVRKLGSNITYVVSRYLTIFLFIRGETDLLNFSGFKRFVDRMTAEISPFVISLKTNICLQYKIVNIHGRTKLYKELNVDKLFETYRSHFRLDQCRFLQTDENHVIFNFISPPINGCIKIIGTSITMITKCVDDFIGLQTEFNTLYEEYEQRISQQQQLEL